MMRKRAGIILQNTVTQEIVLIKRIKPNDTYWVIPGGEVEFGETLEKAAIREFKEELEIEIDNIEKITRIKTSYSDENYFYASVDEKIELEIHGDELQRQTPMNLYQPQWINKEQIEKIKLQPKEMIPLLYSIWEE